MNKELEYWLKLRHVSGLGAVAIQKLLQHFGSVAAICESSASQLREFGIPEAVCSQLLNPASPAIQHELDWVQQAGNCILTLADTDYPPLLKRLQNPPLVLYLQGDPALLSEPQLAIVGSRNATRQGLDNAKAFAEHLTRSGILITSGLAVGIDAAAHQGALLAGPTIAVMATGADCVYPKQHQALAAQIRANGGVLLSEMPLGTQPFAKLFPQRNRIISGLSLGTLVVEATQQSGSLITARLAAEQGREVFAIPGSIHSPLSRGCHRLIRQGAKLVESSQDILEELAPQLRDSLLPDVVEPAVTATEMVAEQHVLLQVLGEQALSVDQIIELSGWEAAEVASSLLILELSGQVQVGADGRYSQLK